MVELEQRRILNQANADDPVACAAALAAIETIGPDGLIEKAPQSQPRIVPRLNRLPAGPERLGDVRSCRALTPPLGLLPPVSLDDALLEAGVDVLAGARATSRQ